MAATKKANFLRNISVEMIHQNPENPRLYFRQQEMDSLTESIRRHEVQVPISVYEESGKFVLLDGERRWRASLKLSKKTIPAIIQEKPTAFANLVLMFNIHALREQWDLLTIAIKLPRVISLFEKEHGWSPNEREVSEETGLARGTIRRCKLLMNLPDHHIDIIKAELKRPKSDQRITEDFYIEMERSLTTVARAMPEIIPDEEERERVRQVLLDKYQGKIINNIVDFRKIAKIARAKNVGVDSVEAGRELKRLFTANSYTIDGAYGSTVSAAYEERDLQTHIQSVIDLLEDFEGIEAPDDKIRSSLERLVEVATQILREVS